VLVSIVLLISGSVLGFSNRYISEEVFGPRFLGLVVIFVLSINMLVFIPNLVTVLLG
jgi:NADH:ubiquinone oxidoreductase subunit 5 (subunit L)/multisubunit Na+/H+ antiporter MnhA subunit